MNTIYFTTTEISGRNENNRSFYLSAEEAKKDTETKLQEELRNVQKLIRDYNLDMPILTGVLKNLSVTIHVRPFAFQEEKVS